MSSRRFGRYRLDRRLGRGSAGEVWLAYDPAEARTVALKILSGSAAEDADYRRRFEREARIGARLDNPHIAPIHRFGEFDGRLYLDMAYIPGVDLAKLVRSGVMGATEAVELISQIAEALDAAHAAGLIHRDVKPANIIVHTTGFAYLIDFGIARAAGQTTITATGFTVGTLAYMAPERFTGHGDARSDVYSLACVLYECLTAQRPFGDTDAVQQLHAHLHQAPPRPSAADSRIPEALDAVIARGMAKQAGDRYRTAGELAAAARAAVSMPAAPVRTPPLLPSEPADADSTAAFPGPPPAPPRDAGRATRELPATRLPAATGYPIVAGPQPPIPAPPGNPRPTLIAPTAPSRRVPVAPPPAPRRRPLGLGLAALIGVALIVFAVVAGCTVLLSNGTYYAPTAPNTTARPSATPAPDTTAPDTPAPQYTTAVIPPAWTIPWPTNIPPPFQFPQSPR
ncbi:serine/threonine-protein kinase [Nocardia spumae]|uniref:serine/threonine-protein kinase n=1 Tax=Nocardia spumae TaxID=2887190 RepID=UPI001D15D29B|nr:serine/threonine-protein kinase [Nocardia spumae]